MNSAVKINTFISYTVQGITQKGKQKLPFKMYFEQMPPYNSAFDKVHQWILTPNARNCYLIEM